MATGRIGVTPTLRTRWSKAPAGGTTSLSGLDDNSVSLVYDVGYEGVYRNGVLLSRGNDYTATDGTTVTLIDATIAGDIIEIFANELIPLSDAISKGQYTAKGALLSATAASTPGVLTVGSNNQVLTADSSTSTGLKWATPASGGMTLLSTTTLSGASTTISSISGDYIDLYVLIYGQYMNASPNTQLRIAPNGLTNKAIGARIDCPGATSSLGVQGNATYILTNTFPWDDAKNAYVLQIFNYAGATGTNRRMFTFHGSAGDNTFGDMFYTMGILSINDAISSLVIDTANGQSFAAGTVKVYGVK